MYTLGILSTKYNYEMWINVDHQFYEPTSKMKNKKKNKIRKIINDFLRMKN